MYCRWDHEHRDHSRRDSGHATDNIVLRTSEAQAAPAIGSRIRIAPRDYKIHHFDAATGRRLENP
ncbi:MAG: hypothetical protein ORN29_03790 [Rhodoferax sp.]|nr:hypothetical protein [Rhodoferax sp.]